MLSVASLAAESRPGVDYEVAFWDGWMSTRGGRWPDDFRSRLNASTPFRFQHHLIAARTAAPQPQRFVVLDVGAGPLTKAGYRLTAPALAGCTLELIAVDPLAREYDSLLRRHRLADVAPVRTRRSDGERLRDDYAENYFDLVVATNSLDHAREPLLALRQMVDVCKCGRLVRVDGHANEAERMNYTGFHQWNFANVGGRLTLHARGRVDVDVLEALGPAISAIRCNEDSLALGRSGAGPISCRLHKSPCAGAHHVPASRRRPSRLAARQDAPAT